jgi:hypothetical protein
MKHRDTAVLQYSPDQEVTMACRWVFFAAKQRNPVVLRTPKYPADSSLKLLTASQSVVPDVVLLVIEFVTIWPPAKFSAERDVSDPVPRQRFLERSRVEVRDIAGLRPGAYIGNDFDVMTLEETEEIVEGDVGVPDGVETRLCARRSRPVRGHTYRHHPYPWRLTILVKAARAAATPVPREARTTATLGQQASPAAQEG